MDATEIKKASTYELRERLRLVDYSAITRQQKEADAIALEILERSRAAEQAA